MVIHEKGLLSAMKEAYKNDGYEIECKETGGIKEIHIEAPCWYVMCVLKNLPRKVLGLIVEHLGEIPAPGQAFQIKKGQTQTKIITAGQDSFGGVTPDDFVNPARVVKTALVYRYGNIWQQRRGNKVFWINPDLEDIMLINTAVVSPGEKVLTITGTVSTVAIKPSEPQKPEDKRMLDYLAGIQLYEK